MGVNIRVYTIKHFSFFFHHYELQRVDANSQASKLNQVVIVTKNKKKNHRMELFKSENYRLSSILVNYKCKSQIDCKHNRSKLVSLHHIVYTDVIDLDLYQLISFFSFHTVNCLSNRKSILITDVCICICVCVRWFIHLIK